MRNTKEVVRRSTVAIMGRFDLRRQSAGISEGERGMRLVDKVSIITGAGSGIGHATAVKFAKEGAKVAVCDINEVAARKVAREINDAGGEAIHFHVDVTNKESIVRMVDGVMAK